MTDMVLRELTLENPAAALGVAVNFMMSRPAFARLPFGHWSRVLAGQINRRHYFFVMSGRTVAGFCGWSLAGREDAEAWLAGESPPGLDDGETGDCIMLNAWMATHPAVNRFIIDRMRMIGKGRRALYGKREYADGRTRRLRLLNNPVFDKHVDDLEARSRVLAPA